MSGLVQAVLQVHIRLKHCFIGISCMQFYFSSLVK